MHDFNTIQRLMDGYELETKRADQYKKQLEKLRIKLGVMNARDIGLWTVKDLLNHIRSLKNLTDEALEE